MRSKAQKMQAIHDDVLAIKCDLADQRREEGHQAVSGEGSLDATIMLIGEAPGKNEAKHGRPFCGAAGKILDALLESVALPREDVYITSIIKDRPPNNRDPLPFEIELYAPLLDRQISCIQPKILATLGRFSMQYILQRFGLASAIEPISKAHGKTYDAQAAYGPVTIVPLYHPAAAIYNQSLKDTLKTDFRILKTLL